MNARVLQSASLDGPLRSAMFELMRSFFSVDEDQFSRDLAAKNWVVLLEDDTQRLVGFSTLLLFRTEHRGERLAVLYSGDTILHPNAWGLDGLAGAWIDSVFSIHDPADGERLLWLLLASGFRTYRYLPVFFREFFPRYDRPTPAPHRKLMHRLATERFGGLYDPLAGVVRFENPQRLRDPLRGIPAARAKNPHVAFFARANAGHDNGDELVCLTEIVDSNLTPAARRVIRAAARRRVATP